MGRSNETRDQCARRTSPRIGASKLPSDGDGFAVVDLRSVGVRQAGTAVQFAINTFGKRTHPAYPAEFDVYVDTNNDGTPDFVLYTAELGEFGATGQTVVFVGNLYRDARAKQEAQTITIR